MLSPFERHHPEIAVGGYSSVDSTVEFYLRVRSLLESDHVVLDLGAGRAAWFDDPSIPPTTRSLLDLRGDRRTLWGCDIDPVVQDNPLLDQANVLGSPESPLPYADESVDLIISDWTFEHLADPQHSIAEMARVLRPGGWVCARTPNKNGYISIANRVIPTAAHERVLRRWQPARLTEDVFPTYYRANTKKTLGHLLSRRFRSTIYSVNPEPAYFGESRILWSTIKAAERLLPHGLGAVLLIFGQRRAE